MAREQPAPYWPVLYTPAAPAVRDAVAPVDWTLTPEGEAVLDTEAEAG